MVLEVVEHAPAVHHRQAHVENDRVRLELVGEGQARVAAERDDALETTVARDLEDRPRERRVVLDDQHDPIPLLNVLTVVLHLAWEEQSWIEVDLR